MNLQLTFAQIINKLDEQRKTISVLVYEINQNNPNKKSSLIKSRFPICPKCLENVILEISDYRIKPRMQKWSFV